MFAKWVSSLGKHKPMGHPCVSWGQWPFLFLQLVSVCESLPSLSTDGLLSVQVPAKSTLLALRFKSFPSSFRLGGVCEGVLPRWNSSFIVSLFPSLSYSLPLPPAQRATLQRTAGHSGLNGLIVPCHVGGASSSVGALATVSITTARAPLCRPATATSSSVTSDVS